MASRIGFWCYKRILSFWQTFHLPSFKYHDFKNKVSIKDVILLFYLFFKFEFNEQVRIFYRLTASILLIVIFFLAAKGVPGISIASSLNLSYKRIPIS